MNKSKKLLLSVSLLLASSVPLSACFAYGCSSSPGWENQGFVSDQGWMIDLRGDYIHQNHLQSGTHSVSEADKALPNVREIENFTTQYYTTLSVDYRSQTPFGVNVSIPYLDRNHGTVAADDSDETRSHTKSLGDIRLNGRYQVDELDSSWGIRVGLKLATGSHTATFDSGPEVGELIDRGLQAGTGTSDMLLGAYRFADINDNFDYFIQAGYKVPLREREGYKPGNQLNTDIGIRWIANKGWRPQLNLNAKFESRDKGVNSDADNSGGNTFYLNPGITVDLVKNLKGYAFIQLPLYMYVNGYQLVPLWTATTGVTYRF